MDIPLPCLTTGGYDPWIHRPMDDNLWKFKGKNQWTWYLHGIWSHISNFDLGGLSLTTMAYWYIYIYMYGIYSTYIYIHMNIFCVYVCICTYIYIYIFICTYSYVYTYSIIFLGPVRIHSGPIRRENQHRRDRSISLFSCLILSVQS